MFYGATVTKNGRYLLPKETEIGTHELLREISKCKKEIKMSYLLEFKKLLINFYNLFKKIGYPVPISSGGLVGFYRVGSLKELIPLREVRKINRIWKRNKIVAIVKSLLKIGMLQIIKLLLSPFNYLLNSNLLVICLGNVNNEYNFKPKETGCIGIEKNRKTRKIMVQSLDYTEGLIIMEMLEMT
jgi:hypothetical protein